MMRRAERRSGERTDESRRLNEVVAVIHDVDEGGERPHHGHHKLEGGGEEEQEPALRVRPPGPQLSPKKAPSGQPLWQIRPHWTMPRCKSSISQTFTNS